MTPKLLVVTPDYPPSLGGIQLLLQRVVEGMPAFTPTVVTRSTKGGSEWDAERPYRVIRLGAPNRRRGALGPVAAATALGLRERPDLVLAGHLLGAPAGMTLSAMRKVPFALYLYADELPNRRALLMRAMRSAALTIAISCHARDLAAELGAPIERCVVIPPGVDLSPRSRHRPEPGLIVTVARLTDRYKGHDMILEALPDIRRHVPFVRWVVVGDGPLREGLEAKAASLGLLDGVVEFVGSIDDAARDDWLDRAAVFTMPSRLPPQGLGGEGFGIVFLEAGMRGLPVVAGHVGGALDAIEHETTGLLVDPTSPAALAGALVRVLKDPVLARRMGAAGRINAEAHAWPRIAQRVEQKLLALTARP